MDGSFQTIQIYRSLPIINGFVQVPPNNPSDKTRVTTDEALSLITDSQVSHLSSGQQILLLPPVNADSWYQSNPIDSIS